MDRIIHLPSKQRSELFSEAALRKGVTPAIIEKDFWVTWILGKLFENEELAKVLMFKGGTSLSKVFHLIERFSEDIDLVLNWNLLTTEDPRKDRSKTKQLKFNQSIDEKGCRYIEEELVNKVNGLVAPVCGCKVDELDAHVINVEYPAGFNDDYLRPQVRLEVGPLASWVPHERYRIRSYAAEIFPEQFRNPTCDVVAIKGERTFWEKATILHHEAHRPEKSPIPMRHSRHYYDMSRMAMSSVKDTALNDLVLLADVVAFKQQFYPRGWARYDLARPSTFRIVPGDHVRRAIEADYRKMREMIFGEFPDFSAMMEILAFLEKEINDLPLDSNERSLNE